MILPGLFGAPRFTEMLDKILSHTSETSRVVLRATRRHSIALNEMSSNEILL